MNNRTISPKSIQRIVQRHLPEYETLIRGDTVYLCENHRGFHGTDLSAVLHSKRMVCAVEDGDNIFGLRHTRAQRIHNSLDEEFQRRLKAPQREREAALQEASDEFREEFRRRFGR